MVETDECLIDSDTSEEELLEELKQSSSMPNIRELDKNPIIKNNSMPDLTSNDNNYIKKEKKCEEISSNSDSSFEFVENTD